MITRGIREYLQRDWQGARDAKDAFWADRIARLGPFEGLRIADDLRRQVVSQQPGWPTHEQRRADLEAHARLSDLLKRADRTGGR